MGRSADEDRPKAVAVPTEQFEVLDVVEAVEKMLAIEREQDGVPRSGGARCLRSDWAPEQDTSVRELLLK